MSKKKEQRLKDIEQKAFLVFSQEGFDAQMSEIARACSIGHGTLYRDFKDKDALFEHILRISIKRAEERWQAESLAWFTRSLLESWTPCASLFAYVPPKKRGPLNTHFSNVDSAAAPYLGQNVRLWRACVFQSALDKNPIDQACSVLMDLFGQPSSKPMERQAVEGWRS